MSNDFWSGVAVGAMGFGLVAFLAGWFRKKLSEFLNPTKKQRVGHSTDKTPSQVISISFWAGVQMIAALALLALAIYTLVSLL